MAKQVITLLTDDLEGGEADQTVEFAVDGVGYTIDLNEKNAAAFREFLQRHAQAGTRVGRVSSNGYHPGQTVRRSGADHPNFTANRELNTRIREWAGDNGYHLSDRGRIPQHVVNAYHRGTPAPTTQQVLEVMRQEPAEPAQKTAAPQVVKKTTTRRRATAS